MPSSSLAVETLDANAARALTDQIKTGVEAVWHLITRAYTERAWDVLGYTSWDDYCTREFGTSRLRLPREERQEVVSSLRESGLSLRAIASATGDSVTTVRRELAGVPNGTPEPSGTDGVVEAECIHCHAMLPLSRLYEGGQGYECDPCVSPDDDVPEPDPEPVATVTGLDGKRYQPKSTPPAADAPPRRKPLVDSARDLGLDLAKLIKRIEEFGADDRLVRNKNEVAPRLRHHLEHAIKVCQDLELQLAQGV